MPTTPESRIKIQVNNLTKRFGDLTVLDGINFNIKEGELLAIVGPTGCGKTTFINLLMRFYDPDGGEILLDGVNTQKMNRGELRRSVGMVLQDTWLKAGTIRASPKQATKRSSPPQSRPTPTALSCVCPRATTPSSGNPAAAFLRDRSSCCASPG